MPCELWLRVRVDRGPRNKGLPPLLRPPTGLAPAGRRPGRRPLASPRSSLCQPLANSSLCCRQGARAPVLSHLTTKNDRILAHEPLLGLSVLIEGALYELPA